MKFYLSSYKFGNEPQKLAELFVGNNKVALIMNAIDFSTDPVRTEASIQAQLQGLKELGLEGELVDLKQYFSKSEELKQKLAEFAGVWVYGGNTFLLRIAMNQSGFDTLIHEYIESNTSFVYAGFSAAVCVLAPSLKGIDLMDQPHLVKEVYGKEIVWEGLGILDYMIVPHYNSDHKESDLASEAVKYLESNNIPFKTLSDGDVIIIK